MATRLLHHDSCVVAAKDLIDLEAADVVEHVLVVVLQGSLSEVVQYLSGFGDEACQDQGQG